MCVLAIFKSCIVGFENLAFSFAVMGLNFEQSTWFKCTKSLKYILVVDDYIN